MKPQLVVMDMAGTTVNDFGLVQQAAIDAMKWKLNIDITMDQAKIDEWFADQELNIGLGISQSSLVVLDFDARNAGRNPKWLELLERCFSCNTQVVGTHDGYHIYFHVEKPAQFKGKIISGIDVKHKGYVVLPPSIHPTGTAYRLVNDVAPVDLPDDLRELMTW